MHSLSSGAAPQGKRYNMNVSFVLEQPETCRNETFLIDFFFLLLLMHVPKEKHHILKDKEAHLPGESHI